MLSRVAENLFWMSRYLERAENVARLLDIGLYLELDARGQPCEKGSAPVEIALNILACRDAFRSAHPACPTQRAVLGFLTFDRTNPQSILSMIALARENARGTQESHRRRRLEPGQSAVPLPVRPQAQATVRRARPASTRRSSSRASSSTA